MISRRLIIFSIMMGISTRGLFSLSLDERKKYSAHGQSNDERSKTLTQEQRSQSYELDKERIKYFDDMEDLTKQARRDSKEKEYMEKLKSEYAKDLLSKSPISKIHNEYYNLIATSNPYFLYFGSGVKLPDKISVSDVTKEMKKHFDDYKKALDEVVKAGVIPKK